MPADFATMLAEFEKDLARVSHEEAMKAQEAAAAAAEAKAAATAAATAAAAAAATAEAEKAFLESSLREQRNVAFLAEREGEAAEPPPPMPAWKQKQLDEELADVLSA